MKEIYTSHKDFTKSFDEALYVLSVLKRLKSGDIETFDKRLNSQKVQYIKQLFGVVPFYSYNLYLHGPYSPQLSSDLHLVTRRKKGAYTGKFLPEELEVRFVKLRKFINGQNNRKLELLTTLHWLIYKANFTNDQALDKLRELKTASREELKYTKQNLKKLCQLLQN